MARAKKKDKSEDIREGRFELLKEAVEEIGGEVERRDSGLRRLGALLTLEKDGIAHEVVVERIAKWSFDSKYESERKMASRPYCILKGNSRDSDPSTLNEVIKYLKGRPAAYKRSRAREAEKKAEYWEQRELRKKNRIKAAKALKEYCKVLSKKLGKRPRYLSEGDGVPIVHAMFENKYACIYVEAKVSESGKMVIDRRLSLYIDSRNYGVSEKKREELLVKVFKAVQKTG